MCIWKSDYFSICGHQPLYLHTTCPRRNLVHDSYTNRNIVRACSKIEISSIASVNAHCPDCLPEWVLCSVEEGGGD